MMSTDPTGEALAARAADVLRRRGKTLTDVTQAEYASALDVAEMELAAAEAEGEPSASVPMRLRRTAAGMEAVDADVRGRLSAQGRRFDDLSPDEYLAMYAESERRVYPVGDEAAG